MFTGIIEELGAVTAIEPRSAGARLVIAGDSVLRGASEGSSIAVNGVCLTALGVTSNSFAADLAPETLARTNLGGLRPGSPVNLERPVTPATLLSGHLVQGHVDATAELVSLDALGNGNYWLKLHVPASLDRYLVEKGSVALDGISLTIATVEPARDSGVIVGVTIIPHTFANTTLGTAKPGSRLNVEADVLAKHVEKLLRAR